MSWDDSHWTVADDEVDGGVVAADVGFDVAVAVDVERPLIHRC